MCGIFGYVTNKSFTATHAADGMRNSSFPVSVLEVRTHPLQRQESTLAGPINHNENTHDFYPFKVGSLEVVYVSKDDTEFTRKTK